MSTPSARLPKSDQINVHDTERAASAFGGGLLVLYGLRRLFSVKGLLSAAAGGALLYRGLTGHCPAYQELGVDTAGEAPPEPILIREALTVYKPRKEVYEFWRDLENLPRFMRHLASVERLGENRTRWTARLPRDAATLTWEARTVEDRAGEEISWRSLSDADVQNAGTVRFKDGPDDSTEVTVEITYRPPAGKAGRMVGYLLNPASAQIIKEDVRRFKHLLETGEIPRIEGQPMG